MHEIPNWIPSCDLEPPTRGDMNDWIVVKQKKTTISDETLFCRKEILHGVLTCKVIEFCSLLQKQFLEKKSFPVKPNVVI